MIELKRFVISLILGWLSVTIIYVLMAYLSTGYIHIGYVLIVAVFVAIYSIVIGVPTYLALKGLQTLNLNAFIIAGICASLPMLIFFVYQGNVSFFIASLISGISFGVVAGLVYM